MAPIIDDPTHVLIIFDKEKRERDQDISCSPYRGGDCPHGIRIAKKDEDHHEITRCFDPPPERYEREIGPDKTYSFIEEEQDYPPIVLRELADPHTTFLRGQECLPRSADHRPPGQPDFLPEGAARKLGSGPEPLRNLS